MKVVRVGRSWYIIFRRSGFFGGVWRVGFW